MILKINIAGWSSLEARRAHNPKVIGSNPVPATYAQIAQLVEQRTENPRVAGSIPALGIFYFLLSFFFFCSWLVRKSLSIFLFHFLILSSLTFSSIIFPEYV